MDAIVRTRQGVVQGNMGQGVAAFKGIPYAAAPFGRHRFQPPQPAEPWEGVRQALTYGPTVPKAPLVAPFDALIPETDLPGQECLNLNIWSRELQQGRLPVMVWIHGGAFSNGSGSNLLFDGTRFARDGVVCVTFNYRLGAEGFLFLGDGVANLGLLDQIAALQWVRENIAAFGGDPENVTLFGQSAGAMSIATLLAMPRARGLFRRAIAQSGAAHHVNSSATARRVGQYLAQQLGVEPTLKAMTAVPIDRLVDAQREWSIGAVARRYSEVVASRETRQAQGKVGPDAGGSPERLHWDEVAADVMPFEPVVDGQILPKRPIESIAAGAGGEVDVLVGTNADEYRLFLIPTGLINFINEDFLGAAIAACGLPVPETLTAYRATRPAASPGELLEAVLTDWIYRLPAVRLAEAHTPRSGRTYMYEFAWKSPQFAGQLGACHMAELPFVFDNLDKQCLEGLVGPHPPQPVAEAMHAAWIAFATRGDPGWPPFELSRRATMCFDTTPKVVEDPRSSERVLWARLR
jgi:para-nitrobenzyl esterase